MVEKFLEQTTFTSQEDFIKNLKIKIPENFNFGYDIVDAWAAEEPDKKALSRHMLDLSRGCYPSRSRLNR